MLVSAKIRCSFRPQNLYRRLESTHATGAVWRSRIAELNETLNALVHVAPEDGYSSSKLPLSNIHVAIKDNICTSTMPTTCSSAILQQFTSPFDATVVRLLRESGATIVGKANCDEFGMGSLNTYSAHGPVVNPCRSTDGESNVKRSAGGSSGGSAAAVAAGMCDVALGTDTGGSIRLPASYCGIPGLKPSYGLLSRWGVVSYADSLDCIGILGKDVSIIKTTFDILSQFDPKDPTSVPSAVRESAANDLYIDQNTSFDSDKPFAGLRVGIPHEYFPAELDHSILHPLKDVLGLLQKYGAALVPISLPSTPYALSAYYVISSAEASSNLARYDGIEYGLRVDLPPGADKRKTSDVYAYTRSQGFGPEVQRRILLGSYALSADAFDNYFLQAQRVRKLIRSDFDNAFRSPNALHSLSATPRTGNPNGVDFIIHPSAIRTAPPLPDETSSTSKSANSLDAYVQDILTVPASLAGLPAISIPAGFGDDGLPVGVSLVGQWGKDSSVLKVAEGIERILQVH
ncbi:Glutamyl-tRNA(Gln) amidotransferase subunit A, mitochondrial [Abortiporus biennis]